MGDSIHLENLGRELKCPICLSLFDSAVSLSCNHIFCNTCIMKSMKSGSGCPVCKVPFRRREIRAAPHMDSLVGIYKSMEVASGVNIFVTQNPPLNRPTDGERQVENDLNCGKQVIDDISQERSNNQEALERRGSTRISSSAEKSEPVHLKPSFPTKKRVQVAQYPLSETPIQASKVQNRLAEETKDESRKNSIRSENPVLEEMDEPLLSPFFWLREEEDIGRSSPPIGSISPPIVPSFSDMKDSDDEDSSKDVVNGNSNGVGLFDSEMFEWTQRACSPELSSPIKMQIADTDEVDECQECELNLESNGANAVEPCIRKCVDNSRQADASEEILPNVPSSRCRTTNSKPRSCKSKKIGGNAIEIIRKKISKRNTRQVSSLHPSSKKEPENSTQKQTSALNLRKIGRKRSKASSLDCCATESTSENVSAAYLSAEVLSLVKSNMANDGIGKRKGEAEDHKSRIGINCGSRSKKRKLGSTEPSFLGEVSANLPIFNEKDCNDFSEKSIKRAREVKSTGLKRSSDLSCKDKMKVSFSGNSLAEDRVEGNSKFLADETTENARCSSDIRVSDGLSTGRKFSQANGMPLRKCEALANKIQCAFCHSSEDSEASGEVIHYYDGRPVDKEYDGSSKIIHSHRSCTEWAPNVYFKNDIAVNLKAEISRSQKITCSCCGLKGAALGCYVKSCRKSFHVPCAKLMPECRWDTDSFVMLCPLHASSKLPNEVSKSQERRKKCISKPQLQDQRNDVAGENISVQPERHPCKSPCKVVICCSALTAGEREIVTEFEKSYGATVLKKWDSNVTHVIASTDENGACKRTLKILMGILEGRWILNLEWVKACMKEMKPVDEKKYEITVDVHGIRDGPRLGRLRLLNKQPKIFDGFKFYLLGDFEPSYKGYLQDLVIAAGGTILHRKPISVDQRVQVSGPSAFSVFIVYSLELPDDCDPSKKEFVISHRQSVAEGLATSTGSKAVSNSWVLNSIAACKLQFPG